MRHAGRVTTPSVPELDSGLATLAAYRMSTARYIEQSHRPAGDMLAYLDRFAALVAPGPVLEIGSGPGWDAEHLEGRGVTVRRTDAAPEFVERLRAAGHDTRVLDVRHDELGGPYRGIVADAVLLHLTRPEFAAALARCRAAVLPGGHLALTLKEGDGAEWTTEKIQQPRLFIYWREPQLRTALNAVAWDVVELTHAPGRRADWLLVIASCPAAPPAAR